MVDPTAAPDDELARELRQALVRYLRAHFAPPARRSGIAAPEGFDRAGYDRAVTELGLLAAFVPEAHGGLGLGLREAVAVAEELGRALVASPVAESVLGVLALSTALPTGQPGEPVRRLLTRCVDEPLVVTVAGLTPAAGRRPTGIAAVRAELPGAVGAWLTGSAVAVPFGTGADAHVVLADEPHPAAYLVDPRSDGVRVSSSGGLDHTRRLATVTLTDAWGDAVGGPETVREIQTAALLALAGESAAAAAAALDEVVAYLRLRRQFGRPLGSFQALRHRCADLAVTVRGAAAMVHEAVTSPPAQQAVLAQVAKVVATDALAQVASESLQLHGGVGFTFEYEVHLYLKRGKANQMLCGPNDRFRSDLAVGLGLGPG